MSSLMPFVGVLLDLFRKKEVHGIPQEMTGQVIDALQKFVSTDQQAQKLAEDYIDRARQHDIATFDASDRFTNRLRSSIRPLCTMVALGWYVYARIYGIALQPEDYAIIGGILAFWFGVRSIEKSR